MTTHDEDIVRDLLARVMACSKDFTQAQALQIELEIRAAWGGERVFIAKVRPNPKEGARYAEQAKGNTAAEVKRGTRGHAAARKGGLSRSTIYQGLKRG